MFSTFDCDQLAKIRQHGSKPNVSRSILAQRRDLKRAPLKTPAWEASSIQSVVELENEKSLGHADEGDELPTDSGFLQKKTRWRKVW